MTQVITARR